MADCNSIVGIKNIIMSFKNCDTGEEIRNLSHKLSSEELPTIRTCVWQNESLPGGFTKRTASFASMMLKVIRDRRIPLSAYQGCYSLDLQIEWVNGNVFTGTGGSVTGDAKSDTHEIELEITFESIDELLPTALAA